MPYRLRKHSTPKPASKKWKTVHRYMVEIGHPQYTGTKTYHVQAENEWEAAKKALANTGAKKMGHHEPYIDSHDRGCEAVTFEISVIDKDTGYA